MTIEFTIPTNDAQDTQSLAGSLAANCALGDCILLRGDLGSGKTTFARGFIQALCGTHEDIVSPTFTLVQTYQTRSGGTIWHYDFYRLKKPEEVLEIGLEEALGSGITLIEWPQLMQERLPEDALEVQLTYGGDGKRTINLRGKKSLWEPKLAGIRQSMAESA
jgi:tRNA threonylcarbamoyladenosine biosynthesis protein TsaE